MAEKENDRYKGFHKAHIKAMTYKAFRKQFAHVHPSQADLDDVYVKCGGKLPKKKEVKAKEEKSEDQ
jgi:hypothetical protein